MVGLAIIIGAVVGAIVLGLGFTWFRLVPRQGHRVVVSLHGTHDEGDIIGVLWERRGGWLLLREASVIEPGSTVQRPMDGEAMVPVDHVRYVQVLP